MPDFFARRDLELVTTFTDPNAYFSFGFEAMEQLVHNDNGSANAILEASFDGVNVHARLQGTGPSKVVNWGNHIRKQLWVRRVAGGPGGSRFVEVLAITL